MCACFLLQGSRPSSPLTISMHTNKPHASSIHHAPRSISVELKLHHLAVAALQQVSDTTWACDHMDRTAWTALHALLPLPHMHHCSLGPQSHDLCVPTTSAPLVAVF